MVASIVSCVDVVITCYTMLDIGLLIHCSCH